MDVSAARAGRVLRAIEALIFARRATVMAVLGVVTVCLGFLAFGIRWTAGFDKALPLETSAMETYRHYHGEFGGANTLSISLIRRDRDIYSKEFLQTLKTLSERVGSLPGVDAPHVHSLFTPDARLIDVVEGRFFAASVIPGEYSATSISEDMLRRIRSNVRKAGLMGRLVSQDEHAALIQADLFDIDPRTGEKLDYISLNALINDQVRQRITSATAYDYRLRGDVGAYKAGEVVYRGYTAPSAGLIDLPIKADRNRGDGGSVQIASNDLEIVEVPNPDHLSNVDVRVTGFPESIADMIDASRASFVSIAGTVAIMAVLLSLYFGSFQLGMVTVIASVTSVVWEAGLLSVLGIALDPRAASMLLLTFAISASQGAHFVNAWLEMFARNQRSSFDSSLVTWRGLILPAATSLLAGWAACAVACLAPFGLIREMALALALGLATLVATHLVMVPIAMTWMPTGNVARSAAWLDRRQRLIDWLGISLSKLVDARPAMVVLLGCAILLGWSVWKSHDLEIGVLPDATAWFALDTRDRETGRAVEEGFPLAANVLKVIAEAEPDACTQSQALEQIDTLASRLENTPGVLATQSLPQLSKLVYTAFSEGSPKFRVLARNRDALVQAIAPITPATGLLNANCSVMPISTFLANREAATINQVFGVVEAYNRENALDFFETHKDVDATYCNAKSQAMRSLRAAEETLKEREASLRQRPEGTNAAADDPKLAALAVRLDRERSNYAGMTRICPVHFTMAAGPLGASAAQHDAVIQLRVWLLLYVLVSIGGVVFLRFSALTGVAAVVLPLALVSWTAYAVMTTLGIALTVTSACLLALFVAVSIDFSIRFYSSLIGGHRGGASLRESYVAAFRRVGGTTMFVNLALGMSILPWLSAERVWEREPAKLLIFLFVASLFGSVVMLPAMVRFLQPDLMPNTRGGFGPVHRR